ncbi:MAG: hypothetical protein WBA97_38000 [Actinophytocola sp.]|uniref:hypothetical protein n=1 Tax=Actinophytocola sp. TaxID=1872138 RepID=UPI003C726765
MRSRRFVAVAAAVAAALVAGMPAASAEPEDGAGVKVDRAQGAGMRAAAVDPIPSEFVSVAPVRVLDTRISGIPVGPGRSVTVDLSAQTPDTATSVVLNVTGVTPTASTFVTVYPAGEARPTASNLNLAARNTRANSVVVALSPDRRVTLYNNSGNTHLVADLSGYYKAEPANRYDTMNPRRVLDTRSGAPLGPRGVGYLNLSSFVPAGATAVTFNMTGVGATASTFLTAYPNGQTRPTASNINLAPGEVVPNQVTVQIGTNRSIALYNNSGNTDVIIDLVGYYSPSGTYEFIAISPTRSWDSRQDDGLRPNYFVGLTGWGGESDPVALWAVAGNVTGVNATAPGFVTLWPGGQQKPNASTLNVVPGQVVANAVTVGIGYEPDPGIADRSVNFANSAGYVDVIFDVAGFFVVLN